MTLLSGSVLLVEDDEIDAELILRGLRRIPESSLDVRWVTNLAAAREAVNELAPQIVLTDLTLPDARQLEVVEALRTICADASLIVQTGVDDQQTSIDALELGAQDYLTKGSITPDVLGRAIRYALARSRTQSELLRAEKDREQSVHELDDFAHVVAHDLRAPVRTARLFADRLLNEIASDDDMVLDYGARLEASLERVDRMILSMLDYASLRGADSSAVSIDVAACALQCAQLVNADLVDAGGVFRSTLEQGLIVHIPEEQLTRVLVNVLANAAKYRRETVSLEVDLEVRGEADRVIVDVVDNGVGVVDEDAERAFELLERLDPRRADGLGFGLAISRRIVEAFGGSIRFVPGRAVGAHVEIILPRS